MKGIILLSLAVVLFSQPLIDFPDFYHTSEDIKAQTFELQKQCSDMKISSLSFSPDIDMVTFGENKDKKNKAFVVFGEHAREMISPETGLHMLKKLCSEQTQEVQKLKEEYELRLILNLNPLSRKKVETGTYCLRENEHGVDLNRNYKSHWNETHDDRFKHVTPGPFAFSEKETQIVRDQLQHFKPKAFFSIHSGTLGLYAPYAWTNQLAEHQEKAMEVLGEIHDKHCPQCKVGSCGAQVGYLAPGTSMDYAFDGLQIPYSYTFEIYNSKFDLREKPEQSFLQVQENDKLKATRKELEEEALRTHSCFAETHTHEMTDDQCLQFFNPINQDQYNYYLENWSNAIILGLNKISDMEAQQAPQQTTQ